MLQISVGCIIIIVNRGTCCMNIWLIRFRVVHEKSSDFLLHYSIFKFNDLSGRLNWNFFTKLKFLWNWDWQIVAGFSVIVYLCLVWVYSDFYSFLMSFLFTLIEIESANVLSTFFSLLCVFFSFSSTRNNVEEKVSNTEPVVKIKIYDHRARRL